MVVILYGGIGNQVLSIALSQQYLATTNYKKVRYKYITSGKGEFKRKLQVPDTLVKFYNIKKASSIEAFLISLIQKFAKSSDLPEYGVRLYTLLGQKLMIVNKFQLNTLSESLYGSQTLRLFGEYIDNMPDPVDNNVHFLCHYRNYAIERVPNAESLQLATTYFSSVYKSIRLSEEKDLFVATTHKCHLLEEHLASQSIHFKLLTPDSLDELSLIKLGLQSKVFIMSNSTLSWLIASLRTISKRTSITYFPEHESTETVIWQKNFRHSSWIAANYD